MAFQYQICRISSCSTLTITIAIAIITTTNSICPTEALFLMTMAVRGLL
jgi:hypothetical protein